MISTTYRNDYVGDGATAIYPYSFKIFSGSDLKVIKTDTSGNETTLTYNVDYTVSGAGLLAGGNVTLSAGSLTLNYRLSVERNRAFSQTTDLRNQSSFFPESIEDGLDHNTMLAARAYSVAKRSIRLKEGANVSLYGLELPAPVASKALVWNASGDTLVNGDINAISLSEIDSLNATYLATGSGAVLRSVHARLAEMWVSVKDFGAVGDGITNDTTAIANAYAALSSGILYFPAGSYVTTGSLTPKDNVTFAGAGLDASKVLYSGTSFWLSLGAVAGAQAVGIHSLSVTVSGSGLGVIRVGSVDQDHDEGLLATRGYWNLRNVFFDGPGATAAGSIGMSVTNYINWTFDNVTIRNFERAAIYDRGGNSSFDRVRWWAYKHGPKWSNQAGTGTIAGGVALDTLTSCEFLGPTTSGVAGVDYGYTVEIDTPGIRFDTCLYEAQVKSQAAIRVTNHGGKFTDVGGTIAGFSALDKSIKLDDDFDSPRFLGTIMTVTGAPAMLFGTPASSANGTKAEFIGCSAQLNALVMAEDPSKYFLEGPETTLSSRRTISEIHNQEGMIRSLKRPAYTQPTPTDGVGFELWYDASQDKAFMVSIDRATSTMKPVLAQASVWEFYTNTDVAIDKRYYCTAEPTFTNGDTTPSVAAANLFLATNSGATSITTFDDGVDHQKITVRATNGNTTLVHGSGLVLLGAINVTLEAGQTVTFYKSAGGWIEEGRNFDLVGPHSAIAAETVTGYLTVKDSSGVSRKLAVVS